MAGNLREHKDNAAHLFASGRLEEALTEYQLVANAAPEDLASRQKVAELLQRLNRKQEAIETYASVADGWARQGWLLRAIAMCKVILQLDPGHGRTQQRLAELYARRLETPARVIQTVPVAVVPEPSKAAQPEALAALPRIPIFSQLGQESFVALLEGLELKTFEAGASIVTEGEPGTAMFAIVEGRVDVVRQLEGSQRRKVAAMGEGDFFGEMALLSKSPRLASVVAAERTVVLELTRAMVARLIQRDASVGRVLRSFHQERLLANVLRGNKLFATLTPRQREAAAQAFQLETQPAGKTMLVQGQPGEALYLVLRGRCRVTHRHPDGKESQYPVLREGDVFGELSMMLGLPATATVRTDSPCTLLRLDRESFEKHILVQPGVREALSRLSTERLQRTALLVSGHEPIEGDSRV
ncbi:MAG TPA: cyclic nucleotide-binding domain-containing protein [Archangium sp.]|nr:cyclic nucleotide-binding domain-containing protein [Archangium sp.]